MIRSRRVGIAAGAILFLASLILGAMPRNWIESLTGVDPDGGNGSFESLLVFIPIAIGMALASLAFRAFRDRLPRR